jgi:hypothetical protein
MQNLRRKASFFQCGKETTPLFCGDCCTEEMVNVTRKKCEICKTKSAYYGLEGQVTPSHCSDCRTDLMWNLRIKRCIKCKKTQASYNFEGNKPDYCFGCMRIGMINVRTNNCVKCHKKQALFNFEGESKATHCTSCQIDSMINLIIRKCEVCRIKPAYYGAEGQLKPSHCSDCKTESMGSLNRKRCVKCKKTTASFNFEGATSPSHCATCQEPGMILMTHKKCVVCEETIPSFNFKGEKKATHCAGCKIIGMEDVSNKKCVECKKKQPSFNFEGEAVASHCADCKLPEMHDIHHTLCVCGKIAKFGIPGQKPSKCTLHQEAGMILEPRTRCKEEVCKEWATYGLVYCVSCEKHAEPNYINLILQTCVKCNQLEACDEKQVCFEYCRKTEVFNFRRKHWENRVVAVLVKNIKRKFFSLDLAFDHQCNAKRPDIVYDCDTFFVIVECDEKQHRAYGDQCEINRMMLIAKAGGLPCIFIPYNPDTYKDESNKESKISDANREKLLVESVRKAFAESTIIDLKDYIRVLYLFYDGFDSNDALKDYERVELPNLFFDCQIVEEKTKKRTFAMVS